MKKILYTMALAAVSLTACQKGDEPSNSTTVEHKVKITGDIAVNPDNSSRTTWKTGEKVGVFMVASGDKSILKSNVEHQNTSAPSAIAIFEEVDQTKELYYPTGALVDFVAYYPYQKDIKDYNFEIDVTKQKNLSGIDLMTASKSGIENTTNLQNLTFNHRLSHVKISLQAGEGFDEKDVAEVNLSIKDAIGKAYYNVSTGEITGAVKTDYDLAKLQTNKFRPVSALGTKGEQRFMKSEASTSTVEAIFIPQNLSDVVVVFHLPDGEKVEGKVSHVTEAFEADKEYTYDIAITSRGVNIISHSITDWTTGGTGTGEAY